MKEMSADTANRWMYGLFCVIFVVIGYLMSIGIFGNASMPVFQLAGSLLIVGSLGFYSVSLLYGKSEELNNKINCLESRIDFLEDTLDEHAEVIDDNRDKINRITDFMWGESGLPNESQEYTSGDPRAEKKEIS